MKSRRLWIALMGVLLISASVLTSMGAPGASRLPWSDVQELLRLQVMGPGAEDSIKEYILQSAEPIAASHLEDLDQLGIEVVSVRGATAIVRGAMTAFSDLLGASERLVWVESVLPHLPLRSSAKTSFHAIELSHALLGANASSLVLGDGSDLVIAVIDGGFTGELANVLGSERVTYLVMSEPDSAGKQRLIAGRRDGEHGTMCAEAIAAMVPGARFLLFSVQTYVDHMEIMQRIAAGESVRVDGQTIDLGSITVVSDSVFSPIPFDHNDGVGDLSKLADEIVAAGIPYVHAIGNFGQGESTERSFYASVFNDTDGNKMHNFDPASGISIDSNGLALTLDPWDSGQEATVTVVLEWDGWPYQIDTGALLWTRDEIVSIQDIDVYVYYQDPKTSSVVLVGKNELNQLESLYSGGRYYPVAPLEVVQFAAEEPGTYQIVVRNATADHPGALKTRAVSFHMYTYASGTTFSMEHNTAEGALINIGAAQNVIGVGAVGFSTNMEWCLMPFSSHGPTSDGRMKPEIAAPNAYKSVLTDSVFAGTSASAPLVAGIVAQLRSLVPQATPAQLSEALRYTAKPLSGLCNAASAPTNCVLCRAACNYGVGCGLIDAEAAYAYLQGLVD